MVKPSERKRLYEQALNNRLTNEQMFEYHMGQRTPGATMQKSPALKTKTQKPRLISRATISSPTSGTFDIGAVRQTSPITISPATDVLSRSVSEVSRMPGAWNSPSDSDSQTITPSPKATGLFSSSSAMSRFAKQLDKEQSSSTTSLPLLSFKVEEAMKQRISGKSSKDYESRARSSSDVFGEYRRGVFAMDPYNTFVVKSNELASQNPEAALTNVQKEMLKLSKQSFSDQFAPFPSPVDLNYPTVDQNTISELPFFAYGCLMLPDIASRVVHHNSPSEMAHRMISARLYDFARLAVKKTDFPALVSVRRDIERRALEQQMADRLVMNDKNEVVGFKQRWPTDESKRYLMDDQKYLSTTSIPEKRLHVDGILICNLSNEQRARIESFTGKLFRREEVLVKIQLPIPKVSQTTIPKLKLPIQSRIANHWVRMRRGAADDSEHPCHSATSATTVHRITTDAEIITGVEKAHDILQLKTNHAQSLGLGITIASTASMQSSPKEESWDHMNLKQVLQHKKADIFQTPPIRQPPPPPPPPKDEHKSPHTPVPARQNTASADRRARDLPLLPVNRESGRRLRAATSPSPNRRDSMAITPVRPRIQTSGFPSRSSSRFFEAEKSPSPTRVIDGMLKSPERSAAPLEIRAYTYVWNGDVNGLQDLCSPHEKIWSLDESYLAPETPPSPPHPESYVLSQTPMPSIYHDEHGHFTVYANRDYYVPRRLRFEID